MTTITLGATVITPRMVTGFRSERDAGTQIHELLNGGAPAVTFTEAGLRTGTLVILATSAAQAAQIEDLHTNPGTFVLDDADVSLVNMTYVPSGKIALELDDIRKNWTVEVGFQEVPS